MPDKTYCLVGTLGLLDHEISLLNSIFRMSNNRDRVHYKLILNNLAKAHIVIATIDNEAAMNEWQKLCKSGHAPVLAAVTPKELGKFPGHSFSRPFSPTKVLSVLDQIFDQDLPHMYDEKIFHGEDTATHKVFSGTNAMKHRKPRALVVDDSKTVRSLLTRELTACNLQPDVTETGESALEMVAATQYDIIFLDVQLPGMDGYQVCKKIKRNPHDKHIPIIMLSGNSSPFDKIRGSMAGCDSYLTKPVDYEKFHQILQQYIRNN